MSTENTQMVVNPQLARIHVILNKIGKMSHKADYVIDITNGREHSTKLLTFDEANAMIDKLDKEDKELFAQRVSSEDKMRKKIISCLREVGYVKGGKADMPRIYSWVLKYGYAGKPLKEYTAKELPKLVTQAEAVKRDYFKRV